MYQNKKLYLYIPANIYSGISKSGGIGSPCHIGQEKVYITVMLGNESLNSGHGSIPPILTKQTITSQLNSLNTKKTVTLSKSGGIGSPCHICVPVPSQDLDFQRHMSQSFLCSVSSVER
jgi:hypothetical protein